MEATAEIGGTPVSSRWNPTKEQISILENLYEQGVRTPSAEQIQQITNRLKSYGHIEGKNVFYWFQNHKARQRQKQKQDHTATLAYFNHFLPLPPFAPHFPSPNGCFFLLFFFSMDKGFFFFFFGLKFHFFFFFFNEQWFAAHTTYIRTTSGFIHSNKAIPR